jgi:hypothetical protein
LWVVVECLGLAVWPAALPSDTALANAKTINPIEPNLFI